MKRRMRSRRRRRQRNYFLQLALAAGGVALVTWMLFVLIEKAIHPYWLGHEVERQVRALREQVARQRKENDDLRAQVRFLQTDEGAEREARQARFYRPGEVIYLLRTARPEEAAAGAEAQTTTAPAADKPEPEEEAE
jgi:cell division protein FtsB